MPPFGAATVRHRGLGRALTGWTELSPMLWDLIAEGHFRGDPLADTVVEWIVEADSATRRAQLNDALHHGVSASTPAPLRTFFEQLGTAPAWAEPETMEEGVRVCRLAGRAAFYVLRDGGLMPGYLSSAINQTLLMTGALQRGARRRLAETMQWWLDCTVPLGLRPGSIGWISTLHVRFMHAFVRHRLRRSPDWRLDHWGLPVNQSDMAGTWLVFAIEFLLGLRALGVPVTLTEGHAALHLWRVIGWLMGVAPHWLIETESAGVRLLWHIVLSQPEPDRSSWQLGTALMNEPLERPYESLKWLRQRFDRQAHISASSLFLSASQLRALGLPPRALPWFPLLRFPFNVARHVALRALPGGRDRLVAEGRAQQEALVREVFGREQRGLGHVEAPR